MLHSEPIGFSTTRNDRCKGRRWGRITGLMGRREEGGTKQVDRSDVHCNRSRRSQPGNASHPAGGHKLRAGQIGIAGDGGMLPVGIVSEVDPLFGHRVAASDSVLLNRGDVQSCSSVSTYRQPSIFAKFPGFGRWHLFPAERTPTRDRFPHPSEVVNLSIPSS